MHPSSTCGFGDFVLDRQTGELRKNGIKVKIHGQPVEILGMLLERPGQVVTREELQNRLWASDTFVDFETSLNAAVRRLREALNDSADKPRYVETLARRGYRFIGEISINGNAVPAGAIAAEKPSSVPLQSEHKTRTARTYVALAAGVVLLSGGLWVLRRHGSQTPPPQRTLTRVTFDEGLQYQPTWSPDGRYIAYSSDRGGKFDIWVQQVSGGNPVQITTRPGNNWQPDWWPDGKYIAYRCEDGDGGLYVAPALGGAGLERKISSFGYFPRWSPDSSQILFQTNIGSGLSSFVFVVGLDGSPPRPVRTDLMTFENWVISLAWHPDGKRISMWLWTPSPSVMPRFLTAPLDSGPALLTEATPEILQVAADVGGSGISAWGDPDSKFSWAPAGEALYFERTFRAARNIWRMKVDTQTLRATAIERLTTGTDINSDLSHSHDGHKIAFASESRKVQAWMFPFDATHGRVTGNGKAVTPPGMEAWETNVSRDGRRLAFQAIRAGRWELWEKELVDGSETPIALDDSYVWNGPQWSPDGMRLAYIRTKLTGGTDTVIWSKDRSEERITKPIFFLGVFDWSPDGKFLLVSLLNPETRTHQAEIWTIPATGDDALANARKLVAADPDTNLWQSSYSPDGRWIVFEAEQNKANHHPSMICVTPASGGPWTHVTEGKYWDDKPRWAPDGRTIYYLSDRKGFFNVWGIHFDPVKGKPQGQPFQVTHFDGPKLMVADSIISVGLGVTQDKLIVNMEQLSGSIWVMDNADR
jgi:Tol biopolymer transport system component/DNA-binding winged helix-turn-helix (wHTH) protein